MCVTQPLHWCTTYPCPVCQPFIYARPTTTTTTAWFPNIDWSPGKGRHRKGDPKA